ncbi:hypothetical protein N665_0233s0021 [Sinapis alba]|nr:hypothetical protein N665_0233s0021 [Sinapis alba]
MQVLHVINGGSRAEIVLNALNSSYLWKNCKVLKLTKNMRLLSTDITAEELKELEAFSQWILDVGDGVGCEPNNGDALITIPYEFLIMDTKDPIESISREVYGDATAIQQQKDPIIFQDRAIICPTNEDVNNINQHMLDKLGGKYILVAGNYDPYLFIRRLTEIIFLKIISSEERLYLKSDSIHPSDIRSVNDQALTPEFFNSINASGSPNNNLRLEIGCLVMLRMNIDHFEGLVNGSRLQIIDTSDLCVKARIITGKKVGEVFLVPRLFITPSDKKLIIQDEKKAAPINKSQGEISLTCWNISTATCVFHGQLYVAIFRVTSKKGLKILIVDEDGKPQKQTKNIIFKEIFQKISEFVF